MCADCGLPLAWSSDGRKLLFQTKKVQPIRIASLDSVTGQLQDVVRHPNRDLVGGAFSPDESWIAFLARVSRVPQGGFELFIARLQNRTLSNESEWIKIAGPNWGLPWWAPDGNLPYFPAFHDKFRCVWAQKPQPLNKRPQGQKFEILPFHGGGSTQIDVHTFGLGLARDKHYFGRQELTSNIWMAVPAQ